MNAQQYTAKVNKLFKSKGLVKGSSYYQIEVQTIFGILALSTEYIPRIKIANIHSKLDGDVLGFKEWLGSSINTYNGKFNLYFEDPEACLNELEELLDNIEYLNINGLPKEFKKNDIVVFDVGSNSIIGEIKDFGFCEIIKSKTVSLSVLPNGANSCCIDYIRKPTELERKTWLLFTKNFEPVEKKMQVLIAAN